MAARKNKGTKDKPWPDIVRERIRSAMLEKYLIEHVVGKREMSATQVQAAKTLMAKILPDQTEAKTDHTGEITVKIVC